MNWNVQSYQTEISLINGFTVFTVDKKAVDRQQTDIIVKYLYESGFDILDTKKLTWEDRQKLAELQEVYHWKSDIRDPALAIFAYDPCPIRPTSKVLEYYPDLDNARIFFKDTLMQIIQSRQKHSSAANGHAAGIQSRLTKNGHDHSLNGSGGLSGETSRWQMWIDSLTERMYLPHENQEVVDASLNKTEAYIMAVNLIPAKLNEIEAEIEKFRSKFRSPFPVVRQFPTQVLNARVDLVRSNGCLAVCKTYKPGRESILENELKILKQWKKIREIPKLLDYGDNWILMEYCERKVRFSRKSMLPLKYVRKIFRALENLHRAGFAHMDYHPGNIIISDNDKVKIVDFENAHEYRKIPPFAQSYDIAGVTNPSDIPAKKPRTYAYWYPKTGLTFESLYHEPLWRQHFRRTVFRAVSGLKKTGLPVRKLKSGLKRIMAGYRIRLKCRTRPRKSIHPFFILPYNQPK